MSLESKLEELNTVLRQILLRMPRLPENETVPTDMDAAHTKKVLEAGAKIEYATAEAETLSRLMEGMPEANAIAEADSNAMKAAKAKKEADASAPTYDEVKKYILQISAKSRDKAVALLARYGAKGGPGLKPEQYAGFVKDALATLAGVYDPEKGE
jgi:hypothetical protein